ncbi:MAG: hypothetical protein WEF86_03065 [Gemmatimonadota bacterium]
MQALPLEQFVPDAATILVVAPLALAYVCAAAGIASWLRVRRGVAAPYTRKTFHFLILTSTLGVQLGWGLTGVTVFAAIVLLVVAVAVVRGDGFPFYEALARSTDAPHRTLFIVVPMMTTAAGGILSNLLFGTWAPVGYMVVAWGDAVGEPVGTRWGRHRYRVPSLAGVPATRSLEGSAAVLGASATAAFLALLALNVAAGAAFAAALLIGAAAAGVEAVSNHGLDNLTMQVAAAATAYLLLG